LIKQFSNYGKILEVEHFGHFVFIEFQQENQALESIKRMNKVKFHGKYIQVEL
jgi:RNA recognition motif-containing protein